MSTATITVKPIDCGALGQCILCDEPCVGLMAIARSTEHGGAVIAMCDRCLSGLVEQCGLADTAAKTVQICKVDT